MTVVAEGVESEAVAERLREVQVRLCAGLSLCTAGDSGRDRSALAQIPFGSVKCIVPFSGVEAGRTRRPGNSRAQGLSTKAVARQRGTSPKHRLLHLRPQSATAPAVLASPAAIRHDSWFSSRFESHDQLLHEMAPAGSTLQKRQRTCDGIHSIRQVRTDGKRRVGRKRRRTR